MINRDFQHLNGLLSDFFSQKNIQQKLHIIHEHKITGWVQERYMAIEFKQNPNPTTCVKNMASDLKKIGQMRKSELDLRSVWAVGITKVIENDQLHSLAETYLDKKYYQTKNFNKHIQHYPIGNTPYCYIIM
ncbi:hypothetical protein [Dickeya oryzae]|uniref:Uncharacterized protein n=1 Tax=Dickeya oryzae TaxID=1240404 RepID=A0AB39IFZ0_9GAMM|nr:hypothetical protein [Dickeya oryzae]MCA6994904.1 hypothetical protein [Dickeya oryzae]